jgi:hypothetical protein
MKPLRALSIIAAVLIGLPVLVGAIATIAVVTADGWTVGRCGVLQSIEAPHQEDAVFGVPMCRATPVKEAPAATATPTAAPAPPATTEPPAGSEGTGGPVEEARAREEAAVMAQDATGKPGAPSVAEVQGELHSMREVEEAHGGR